MNIILFSEEEIKRQENIISVSKTDFRVIHLQKILKLKAGDTFLVGIINVAKYKAKVIGTEENTFKFELLKQLPCSELYPVVLAVSQVRPICMKRILREAVSLGAKKIVLILTDTGEKSYGDANLYKSGEYKKYLLNGAMQSGSCYVSSVEFYNSVDDFLLAYSKEACQKLVLDNTNESKSLSKIEIDDSKCKVLAIGGERGWSDRERGLFRAYGYNFGLIGSRILRTETACDVGLSMLLSRMNLL